MGLVNFIPTIWSARLMEHLRKALVYAGLTSAEYTGELQNFGDTIKIGQVGPITVSSYARNGTVTWQELDTGNITMSVKQAASYSFKVDNLDAAQAKPRVMDQAMENASHAVRDQIDQYIAALYAQAGLAKAELAVNSANVLAAVTDLARIMDEGNVPGDGRWLVVPPWMAAAMTLAKVLTQTDNAEVFRTGLVGQMMGFNIYKSNNVPIVSSTKYQVMAGQGPAIASVVKALPPKAVDLQDTFADGVKGLVIYDAKVLQPDRLLVWPTTVAAE